MLDKSQMNNNIIIEQRMNLIKFNIKKKNLFLFFEMNA